VSAGTTQIGILFAKAVAVAVNKFAEPGPEEAVTANIFLRKDCFAKPIAE
jgi:hypothetical protein